MMLAEVQRVLRVQGPGGAGYLHRLHLLRSHLSKHNIRCRQVQDGGAGTRTQASTVSTST